MGLAKVQVQIVSDSRFPEKVNLIMSRSLAQTLHIKTQPFRVSFGSSVDLGAIALSKINSNLILMSSKLAAPLNIGNQSSIYAHFDHATLHLRFGPLFGIMLNTPLDKTQPESPFGPMTRFLEECTESGHSSGVQVVVFHPNNLNLEQKHIQGWVRKKEKWVEKTFPLPDVIYNRITSRKIEQQEAIQQKLTYLRNHFRIPIFNEKFLDKFQVYDILKKDIHTHHMLPETHLFHLEQLKQMLLKYPVLYLKPTNGSLGNGIIRISHTKNKFIYQTPSPSGTLTQQFTKLSELIRVLLRRIGKQKYIIQQGLHLVHYEGRNVDFRVLIQKDKHGEWKITSAVGRIANDRNIVSNLARGGTIRKAGDILNELISIPNKPSIQQLRSVALEIITSFESFTDGHYAELGIDIGLDQNGNFWLIEMNSKPSKTTDTILNPTLRIRPSVNRLLEYICFLSGLTEKRKIAPIPQTKKPFKPRRNHP